MSEFTVVFAKSLLIKDDKAIFFAAFHAEGRNGKDDPSPDELVDLIERNSQVSVEGIYRQLVGAVDDRGVCKMQSAADYSAAA